MIQVFFFVFFAIFCVYHITTPGARLKPMPNHAKNRQIMPTLTLCAPPSVPSALSVEYSAWPYSKDLFHWKSAVQFRFQLKKRD